MIFGHLLRILRNTLLPIFCHSFEAGKFMGHTNPHIIFLVQSWKPETHPWSFNCSKPVVKFNNGGCTKSAECFLFALTRFYNVLGLFKIELSRRKCARSPLDIFYVIIRFYIDPTHCKIELMQTESIPRTSCSPRC